MSAAISLHWAAHNVTEAAMEAARISVLPKKDWLRQNSEECALTHIAEARRLIDEAEAEINRQRITNDRNLPRDPEAEEAAEKETAQ